MTSLLDVLKETDLRVGFTEQFHSVSSRETLERKTLQRRLLLCLFGLGTNTGLKRISTGGTGENYPDLLYIKRRYIHKENLRNAIGMVVNAIFQNDQMIKYATALRLGTAETEVILKRFNRSNLIHPTYQALAELGKAVKTIFLCEYLQKEELRQEIHEGLNVVEQWNSANSFIFYGKNSEIATNRLEDQEIAVLSLHLLQICLVYINTLMMQQILSERQWLKLMQKDDFRALTPLIWGHINPYGTFRLDMDERLLIGQEAS